MIEQNKKLDELNKEINNIIINCIDNRINSIDTSNLIFFTNDDELKHLKQELEIKQRRINYFDILISLIEDIDKIKTEIDDEVKNDIIHKLRFAYNLLNSGKIQK